MLQTTTILEKTGMQKAGAFELDVKFTVVSAMTFFFDLNETAHSRVTVVATRQDVYVVSLDTAASSLAIVGLVRVTERVEATA